MRIYLLSALKLILLTTTMLSMIIKQNQDDSESESGTSDTEQSLVKCEVQYDSDDYDLEI